MGSDKATSSARSDWKKRESFGSAMAQIGVVALILAGAVYFVHARGARKKETSERLKEARAAATRDNAADLQKAMKELDALFVLDPSAPDALALAADVQTELWLTHRSAGADGKAKEYLGRAEAANSRSEDRYSAHAIQMLAAGQAQQAEAFVDELRKKGASSAKLWYAQALASREQGNLALAKQSYAQAMDKAWKNPRFSAAFAEALLDEGNFFQAQEMADKALAANPEHIRGRLAKAMIQLYKRERVKDAADVVKELLATELTPGMKARALAVSAELATFEQRFDDAIKDAGDALALNPDEYYALVAKARALAMKKDAGALDAYKAAVAKRKTAPGIYMDGAAQLQAAGNLDGAMALLDLYAATFKEIKITSGDGETYAALDRDDKYWITRGDVLRGATKLDEALVAYDQAIAAKNVNQARAHFAKGALFLEKKDYDKAAETLTLITPPDGTGVIAEAYLAMGDTLFAKKDFAAGCQNFAFALTRFKAQQAPRERLNTILEDVTKRLVTAGQKPMSKLWMDEAKPLIQ